MRTGFTYGLLLFLFVLKIDAQISGYAYKNDYDNPLLNTEDIKTEYSRTWMENGEMNFELKNGNFPFFSTEYAACDPQKDFTIETELTLGFKKGVNGKGGLVWGFKNARSANVFVLNESNQFRIYQIKNSEHIDVLDWTETGLLPEALAGKIKLSVRQAKGVTEFYINGKKKHSCPALGFFGSRVGYSVGISMSSAYLYVKQNLGKFDLAANARNFVLKEHVETGFDAKYNEINPMVFRDGKTLFFTRVEKNRMQNTELERTVYTAKLNTAGELSALVAQTLSLPGQKEVLLSFAEEEKKWIVFTTDKGKTDSSRSEFYRHVYDGKKIVSSTRIRFEPMNAAGLPQILSVNKCTLSKDKKAIIFSANCVKNGIVQADLMVANIKNDSTWTVPELLAGDINTAADEDFPFLFDEDRTLYFSSAGHTGYGNQDVFVCHRTGDGWTQWTYPENMGNVVNGPGADEFFFIPEKGDYAWMSSTSGFWNNLDLYRVKLNLKKEWKLYGLVLGKNSGAAQSGARVKISDPLTGKMIDSVTAGKNGEYQFLKLKPGEYSVTAESGILSSTLHVSIHQNEPEINFNILLSPVENGQSMVLHDISFEPNKFELLESSFSELDKLVKFMNENKEVRIEIHGHTSMNNEGDKFNVELSTQRAAAVKKYLTDKGIKTTRIDYKGFGYNEPIYKGQDKSEQAKNRRVEIIFLK